MVNIKDITVNDIKQLTLDQLSDPAVLSKIEQFAADDVYDYEPALARDFYESLFELVDKNAASINGTVTYSKLKLILIKLGYQAIQTLGKKHREKSLSENLTTALKNNVDVAHYIQRYLDHYEFGFEPDKEERQIFLSSITNNEESIGTQQITLKTGESVRNTVTNWIKDYLGYVDPNSYRGSYDLTQYMYTSPNAKTMNDADKQLLTSILEIYSSLRFPKQNIDQALSAPRPPVNIPKPTPKTPQPVAVAPPKEMTAFEKKLSQISSPAPSGGHGVDLEILKRRLEQAPAKVSAVANKTQVMTPQEIKREVTTPELPAHLDTHSRESGNLARAEIPHQVRDGIAPVAPKIAPVPQPKPVVQSPVASPKPVTALPVVRPKPPVVTTGISLADIKTADDLKKLDLIHLRRGSIDQQVAEIKAKIIQLARTNKIMPYYLLASFEQSPLFKAYLAHGSAMFEGKGQTSELSQQEFEGIADLRKEIQHL